MQVAWGSNSRGGATAWGHGKLPSRQERKHKRHIHLICKHQVSASRALPAPPTSYSASEDHCMIEEFMRYCTVSISLIASPCRSCGD